MKRTCTVPPRAFACLAFFAFTAAVQAAPLTLANASFEAPVTPDATGRFAFGESRDFGPNGADNVVEPGDENNLTGWTTVTTENGGPNGSEIAVGFINITPAQGAQVLSLQSGASTRQFTDVAWSSLNAGDVITLTVAIGDRSTGSTWADQSFFALIDDDTSGPMADGTLLGSTVTHSGELATPFSDGTGIDSGAMQDRSFSYTVLAGDLARPGNVGVLLAAFGTVTVTNTDGGLTPNSVNQAFFDNVRIDLESSAGANLKIVSVAFDGTNFTIHFTGEPDTTYDIASDPDLSSGFATIETTATTGASGNGSKTFPVGANRFFRVQTQ